MAKSKKKRKKAKAKRRAPVSWRQGSPINRTDAALLGRGVDRATAAQLRASGWTLARLKGATDAKLKALGLTPLAITGIRKGARSEIPFDDLAKVLIANQFTCCVCHNTAKSIIVHHISEWAKSHDHSPKNLAVLCLDDHDRVHTKKELARNLTAALLRRFKSAWEDQVRQFDATAVLDASRAESTAWQYFNHARLFELAKSFKIKFDTLDAFASGLSSGVIRPDGLPAPRSPSAHRP